MFTQTRDDKRWNVFEVKLDGSGFKPLINNEEPDLEFYDGTYLPDGRILAISNIGYQGVPCVNGSDAVGNLVLYDPQKGNLDVYKRQSLPFRDSGTKTIQRLYGKPYGRCGTRI